MNSKIVSIVSSKTGKTETFEMPVYPRRPSLLESFAKQIHTLQKMGLYPIEPVLKEKLSSTDEQLLYMLQVNLVSWRKKKA